jgi:hypothetical protein
MLRPLNGLLPVLLAATLLPRCGIQSDIAGNGSETTNGITVAVLKSDLTPAIGATVRLIDAAHWIDKTKNSESVVIESLTTNRRGYCTLPQLPGYRCNLQIDAQNEGQLVSDIGTAPRAVDTIVLQPYGSYDGLVRSQNGQPAAVLVAGSSYIAEVDAADSSFALPQISRGTIPVFVAMQNESSREFLFVKEIEIDSNQQHRTDTLQIDSSRYLMFEDFENPNNHNDLSPMLGGGFWDAHSDSYAGGTALLSQPVDASPTSFPLAIRDGGDGRATCLQILYVPGEHGSERTYSYVNVEADIGRGNYDLTALDSISFWAKGDGAVILELVQRSTAVHWYVTAADSIVLTDTWQKFTVSCSDLKVSVLFGDSLTEDVRGQLVSEGLPAYASRPTSWTEMGAIASRISFICTGGSEVWLDNIRLFGLTVEDLMQE